MKKFLLLVVIIAILFSLYSGNLAYNYWKLSRQQAVKVVLVYSPQFQDHYIMKAYESLFEEEGIPYEKISSTVLISLKVDEIVKNRPAIIFPDGVAQILLYDIKSWIKDYLQKGGYVAVIYDAGTKDKRGRYLEEAYLSDIVGVNYIHQSKLLEESYTIGNVKFEDSHSLDYFQFPIGKFEDGLLLSGYSYGVLEYPIARNEIKGIQNKKSIYAYAVATDGKQYPAIVLTDYGIGKALYVNMPLGHLKCQSDDLPMRAILRAFLFKVAKIPYLLNAPYGKGGVVLNWHVDSNAHIKGVIFMLKNGIFRKNLESSIHITAGDYMYKPGDYLGFDACGKGRTLVEELAKYGIIGSHGGWGHDWFANNVEAGRFTKKEIFEYVYKNNICLENIIKNRVIEYSAPKGVHPQPVMTEILEGMNIGVYYYTGDTGSAPNRTFFDGKMISDKIIAFPVMPFGSYASLDEIKKGEKREDEVKKWFIDTVDYVIKNRTVRLVYSHPSDVEHYKDAVKSFLDYVERLQEEEKIQMRSMSYFADFMHRFLKTKYTFELDGQRLKVSLNNPETLEGITVAIPRNRYKMPYQEIFLIDQDEDYYYLTFREEINEKTIYFDAL